MGKGARAGLAVALGVVLAAPSRGETLEQAWQIALHVNLGLQSRRAQVASAGETILAARAARLPYVRSITFNSFLSNTPKIKPSPAAPPASGPSPTASQALALTPSLFNVLGPGQTDFPLSLTFATVPIYTGGRIARGIESARADANARRADVGRTALDLKLTVAEAYVGVLRARRTLETARSDVERLSSFLRDVTNRRTVGLAIRSDELAAQVALSNARLGEIQARTALESAWATYDRYLQRPLDATADLEELTVLPPAADWRDLAVKAMQATSALAGVDEAALRDLTRRALASRPELAGLTEQARALGAQAEATRGHVRPQVGFAGAFVWAGNNLAVPQGIGAAALYVDWTLLDGRGSRRRAEGLRQQERAALLQKADTAADIALQVRTRWLDLQQAHARVPVARVAVVQSEESLGVVLDRYRQQLSNYTEVLDAETRRVQALTNFYNSLYDENLAVFRLRRAVGDL